MQTTVCTLFEGDYHYGLAALVNSLHKNQFQGDVYAGFRGELPEWALKSIPNSTLQWKNGATLIISEYLQIHFLPIDTTYHLTNYKPDFMLSLLEGPAKEALGLFYFDPDIVIKCDWHFFEKWITHGVALVHEITSNDMPDTHPLRQEWKQIIRSNNLTVARTMTSYINGGFCGIQKKDTEFIRTWKIILDIAYDQYNIDPAKFMPFNRMHPFYGTDQDALNISAMCYKSNISEIGPEGMDFIHGGWIMSHAVGSPKPWRKNYFISSLRGLTPSLPDHQYWNNVNGVINSYPKLTYLLKKTMLLMSSFIGRFYSKI